MIIFNEFKPIGPNIKDGMFEHQTQKIESTVFLAGELDGANEIQNAT